MSLALATVIYEWRRYSTAIIALAFSGLLVLAMVGLFAGLVKSSAKIDSKLKIDLVVAPADGSVVQGATLPRRVIPMIYTNSEVSEVVDGADTQSTWQSLRDNEEKNSTKTPKTSETDDDNDTIGEGEAKADKTVNIGITVFDPVPGAALLPVDFTDQQIRALQQPYGVMVDRTDMKRLGLSKIGDKGSINGKAVVLMGILEGYANFQNPTVMMSRQTVRLLGLVQTDSRVGGLNVRIKHPERAAEVRDQLNAVSKGNYKVYLHDDFIEEIQKDVLKIGIIAGMLQASVVLGALIGTVITWQTLYAAIMANIKEFAGLRALGVPISTLRWTVLELSFWVGVAGLALTAALVALVAIVGRQFSLEMAFPLDWVTTTVIMMMIVALMSGFFSVGALKKGQPADLLR